MTKESKDIDQIKSLITSNDPAIKYKFDAFKDFIQCVSNEELFIYNFMIDLYDDFEPKLETKQTEERVASLLKVYDERTKKQVFIRTNEPTGRVKSELTLKQAPVTLPNDQDLLSEIKQLFIRDPIGLTKVVSGFKIVSGKPFGAPGEIVSARVWQWLQDPPNPKDPNWYQNFIREYLEE